MQISVFPQDPRPSGWYMTMPSVPPPVRRLEGQQKADWVVVGAGFTGVAAARRLAELVPSCELALIPNVKHMTFWDGDGALHALQDFLARHQIRGNQPVKSLNIEP
jgi:pimeloyl-ACP methyl ester carboxylesterase